VRVDVPDQAGVGEAAATVVVSAHGAERARVAITVEVGRSQEHGFRRAVMTTGIVSTRDETGNGYSIGAATISGALTADVDVSGRFTSALPTDAASAVAMSTLGYSGNSNFIALSAQQWAVAAGTTNLVNTPLSGQNVMGRGGFLRLGSTNSGVEIITATPLTFAPTVETREVNVAGHARFLGKTGGFTASFAHMRDDLFRPRQLDEIGIGGRLSPWSMALVSGEIAERRFVDGRGLGYSGEFGGFVLGNHLDVQAFHAPGGSNAFAPARNSVIASMSRAHGGRLSTSGSMWQTDDDNSITSRVRSRGASFSPSVAITRHLDIGTDLRGLEFTSADNAGALTSNQAGYSVRAGLQTRLISWSADAYQNAYTQGAATVTGQRFATSSMATGGRAQMSVAVLHGSVGVNGSLETQASPVSPDTRQKGVGFRADRLQPIPWLPGVTLGGSLWRLSFANQTLTSKRVMLNVELPLGAQVSFAAEQSALLRSVTGRPRTILSMKVERSSSLTLAERGAPIGVVFQDLNGNGLRDSGEPGVPGVIVRCDGESAITDQRGQYRFTQGFHGRVEIDQRSLPVGWLQTATMLDASAASRDIGVLPTAGLEIRVTVAGPTGGSPSNVRLGVATIVLRDSSGREWLARTDRTGQALFDALPPGRYEVEIDVSEATELLLIDRLPALEVRASTERQHLEVVARTRPIRMYQQRTKESTLQSSSGQESSAAAPVPPAKGTMP